MEENTACKFKWSIIGSGHIARKVARELFHDDKHEIVAVFSRNAVTGEDFAKKFGGKYCNNIAEFLSVDCHCVYIASPPSTHYTYTQDCLNAGKNILCEKPATVNSKQFESLVNLAREKGVYLSTVLAFKFGRQYRQLKEDLKANKYGKIEKLHLNFGFDARLLKKRLRLFDPFTASGALMENGIYMMAFVEDMLGFSTDMTATEIFFENGVDMDAVITMTVNGTLCDLRLSLCKVLPCEGVLQCEKGLITLPFFNRGCCVYYDGNPSTLEKDQFSFLYQFDKVREEVLRGDKESSFNTNAQALNTMKMMDVAKLKIGIEYPEEIERI